MRSPSDAFTFLLFILAIHATTVFPGRIAAGWIGLFYLLASFSGFLAYDLENAIGNALFSIAIFFLAGMIGHNTRQAELARLALVNSLTQSKYDEMKVHERERFNRLLLEVTWEALEDAGIAPDGLAGLRTPAAAVHGHDGRTLVLRFDSFPCS